MSSILEIIELPSGEIVLQRVDGDQQGEPLLKIHFSAELKNYLQENHTEIAKAMINTGIDLVGKISDVIENEEGQVSVIH